MADASVAPMCFDKLSTSGILVSVQFPLMLSLSKHVGAVVGIELA